MNISWQIKHFQELNTIELYDILALRAEVFVVEQNCAYQDLDGKDKKSYHLIGRNGHGTIVCTARILPQHLSYPQVSIGRVVIHPSQRGSGIGHELMYFVLNFIKDEFGKEEPITISAQKHLEKFYNYHKFISISEEYLEDDIPHIKMQFNPKLSS